ncbi:MAG: DUF790 family protein, partial [Planctomycetota bacterium]
MACRSVPVGFFTWIHSWSSDLGFPDSSIPAFQHSSIWHWGSMVLTRDLLRFRADAGRIEARLLKPTPAVLALAEQLLTHWRGGSGRMLGELEDGEQTILHGSRQMVVGRGLAKVIVDACTF